MNGSLGEWLDHRVDYQYRAAWPSKDEASLFNICIRAKAEHCKCDQGLNTHLS